jgi:ubiquinone/menaquinone biosynthesis C-methylase UbiE
MSARLALPSAVSFHARGDACFAWHGDTGDVCEMSRDVVGLMLAFGGERGGSVDEVCAARPGGVAPDDARRFIGVLEGRGFLRAPGARLDLGALRPFVSRYTVFEVRGDDAVVHARDRSIALAGGAALLVAAEEGTRTLGDLWPRARFAEVARLCRADVAALKLLPPGEGLPRWAESTMPWPAVDGAALAGGAAAARDPAALHDYHARIDDAERQFDEIETTLSHLFREPHRALGGERYGDRMAAALVQHGVAPSGARVVEVGGGLGWLSLALRERLAPSSYVIVDRSPQLARAQRARGTASVVGDATALPVADASVDLVVSNEMAGDLPADGALRLVDECARVLAPGGVAWVSEFGHPTAPPRRSDHLDHDERSIRFDDLRRRARERGLEAAIAPVPSLLRLDEEPLALSTTRASYAALRRLIEGRGGRFPKRAWLIDELEPLLRSLGIAPANLHGLVSAPVGDRTMGLRPREFWALLVRKPGPPAAPAARV